MTVEPNRLTDLVVEFVSLVPRGAHPDARVLLTKRDTEEEPVPTRVRKAPKTWTAQMRDRAEQAGHTMPGGGFPIENMADLHRAMQAFGRAGNPAAAKAWMLKRAKALNAPQDVIDRINAFGTASKSDGGTMPESKTAELPPEVQDLIAQADLAKADAETQVATLEERVAALEAERDEARAALDAQVPPDDGEINKADLPPAVRERLEKAEAAAAVAAERIEKMEEANRVREHVLKAAAYDNIAAPAELGPVLADIAKNAPGSFERLEHWLAAAQERIGTSGLTSEVGWNGGSDAGVVTKIDGLAAELRKTDPTMTRSQAVAKVLEANPELYAEHRRERQSK